MEARRPPAGLCLALAAVAVVGQAHAPDRPKDPADAVRPDQGFDDLLEAGRGIDHLAIAVRDLAAARETYAALVFTLGDDVIHATGTRSSGPAFADGTQLQLIAVNDAGRPGGREVADRLAQYGEGPLHVGFDVDDAAQVVAYLLERGFATTDALPATRGDDEPDGSEALTFRLREPDWLASLFLFVEYPDAMRAWLASEDARRLARHANTATGIRSVWLAVSDLRETSRTLEAMGWPTTGAARQPALGARGQEKPAGSTSLVLLQPDRAGSLLDPALRERPVLLVGATLLVEQLDEILARLPQVSRPEVAAGTEGRAVLLPPDRTHGLWLELLEDRPGTER